MSPKVVDVRMMIQWGARAALLFALATPACADATAPGDGTFQVIIADTVRSGDMRITIRNATPFVVRLDWCNVTFERELSTDVWPAPASPQNVCSARDFAPGYEEWVTRTAPSPGRYRYVYPYYLGDSGEYLRAYSNAFVALP